MDQGDRETWRIVHLKLDHSVPGAAAAAVPRYEIHWLKDCPVAGFIVDEAGRRPHPRAPGEIHPSPVTSLSPAAGGPNHHRLTVIIPTRDRPEDLERCLESLAAQSMPPGEIIVVDNASRSAEVAAVAQSAGAIWVREERTGLDYARNAGIAAARGGIIAFCDDDVVLHRHWCRKILTAFDDPAIDALTGLVLPLELETEAQRTFEFEWGFGRGFERIDFGPTFFKRTVSSGCPAWLVGAGASMAFRRSVFDKVGLFDERLDAGRAGCSGDSELWYRILAHGGTCRYEPRIVSFHRHRRSKEELRRQLRAYMRGHVTALLIQHQRFGHRGNLLRAFVKTPFWYIRRVQRKILRGGDPYLWAELKGYAGGFLYFARHPRIPAPNPGFWRQGQDAGL